MCFRTVQIQMFSCISHSIDICTIAIENIRNMHAVSTDQIADILHSKDKYKYHMSLLPVLLCIHKIVTLLDRQIVIMELS